MPSILAASKAVVILNSVDTELLLDVHYELDKRIKHCSDIIENWYPHNGAFVKMNIHNREVYTLIRMYVIVTLANRGLTMMDML